MDRPSFSEPKTPEMKSPAPEISEKLCGVSWNDPVRVRVPFRNIDKYEVHLAPFGDMEIMPDPMGDPDFIKTSRAVKKRLDDGSIGEFVYSAREMLEGYKKEGLIDPKNYGIIDALIKRAGKYIDNGKRLWSYWATEYFTPNSHYVVDGWPLDKMDIFEGVVPAVSSLCGSKRAPETVDHEFWNESKGARGDWDIIKIGCPSAIDAHTHAGDRELFCRFGLAAVINARCAQEAATAVGIYNRNKKMQVGLGVKARVSERPEIGALAAKMAKEKEFDPGLITPAEAVPPELPELKPEEPKPKKKDNTMLIVGAAALGILAVSKK